MASALFLTYAAVTLIVTGNALRRPSPPTSRFPPLWLPAMVTSELAPLWLSLRAILSAGFVAAGALRVPIGWVALAMVGASEVGLLLLILRSRRVTRSAAGHVIPSARGWERLSGRPSRLPDGVRRLDGIAYHGDLTLDLYRGADLGGPAPALIYVHGGAWTGGDPHRQARILFHHLATRGWVVATIRYPLSPAATFPDHLVGLKRAIAWAKTTGAADHGIDPGRVAVAGGSAGAHLAALAALTPDRSAYQPGFEQIDTSVAACVPMYGVYDFLNRHRTRPDWPVIPRDVMKAERAAAEEAYRQASPLDQVGPSAPPFLVVHGSHDSLVPPAEAHRFVAALEAASDSPVEYLEVEGAQHAFDSVSSPRTRAVTARITRFLEEVVTRSPHGGEGPWESQTGSPDSLG